MNEPRAYDLNNPREIERLHRELYGYMRVCVKEHHGTDREGRHFAFEALRELVGLINRPEAQS